jgi:hypothetical protein
VYIPGASTATWQPEVLVHYLDDLQRVDPDVANGWPDERRSN